VLRMPVGTIVTTPRPAKCWPNCWTHGEKVLLAKGGDGGFGNLTSRAAPTARRARRPRLARRAEAS
jgi:GTP-binding protein